MGLRHVAAATSLVVLGATFSATPVQAREPADQRVAASKVGVMREGDHLPASADTNVPPRGTSMLTSPTLAPDVTAVKITLKPKNPAEDEEFDQFFTSVNSMPKSKRLLACTMMYQLVASPEDTYNYERHVDAGAVTVAGSLLLACLRFAGLLQSHSTGAGQQRAATKCGRTVPSLPMKVTHDSSGYTVTADGTPQAFRKSRLKVRCKFVGDALVVTVKSSKKGQPLRKAAGKKLMIGLASPPDAETSVPVRVTFARG